MAPTGRGQPALTPPDDPAAGAPPPAGVRHRLRSSPRIVFGRSGPGIRLKIGPPPKPGEEDTHPPDLIGLRDWALIGVLVYSFARIRAVVGMSVEGYYRNGKRWWAPQIGTAWILDGHRISPPGPVIAIRLAVG